MDLCFELAMQITGRLADAVTPVDEVHGFRYFDERDLLGFVDGTENPTGDAAVRATVIGPEDPDFAGGSYVIVQKYLHDLDKWNALPVEQQENVIGRYKLSDVEQPDDVKPSYAHNALTFADRPRRQRNPDPPGQHAVRPAVRKASTARTTSAMHDPRTRSSRCCRTCSSGCRRATTTGSST